MSQTMVESQTPHKTRPDALERLFKMAVVFLAAAILLAILTVIGRAAIYKIHAYERGLHLRGGRFLSVQEPGWHIQIPLVDTVIIVRVNERLGYVDSIQAMTADDVTMDVSLQYTYRVINPERYALEVDDPERIVFEFAQGRLRDVINTKPMAEVMRDRNGMNLHVMQALREKEEQYGVQFITVQIQNAMPPREVLEAITDRMVAGERQQQAQAEAAQRRTQADAEYYAAQRTTDASAYQITTLAQADAQRIALTTAAQQEAVRTLLGELQVAGSLGEQYIQVLMAEALRENSKWVISGENAPTFELRTTP